MSRSWIVLGWLLFVAALSLTQPSAHQHDSEGCTDEDYAIFSAALDGVHGKHKLDSVILLDHTATGYPPGLAATTGVRSGVQTFYNDVPKEAKDDFEARNKTRIELDTAKIKAPFQMFSLSDEEAEKLLHRVGGWEAFHQQYPGTAILAAVSRPGISRERNRALLYLGESCGPTCGGGTLLLLGKEDGKWKIINTATVWMS
jgi:hypothetical protein